MKKIAYGVFVSFTLISCLANSKGNQEHYEIKHIDQLIENIKQKVFDVSKVLVVFDIDSTLLSSKQVFGSDTWYLWQSTYADLEYKLKDPCLYNVAIPMLTRFNHYIPVEIDANQFVPKVKGTVSSFKYLKKNNFKSIALTSRSPTVRIETERELKNNQIIFEHVDFDKSTFDKNNENLSYKNSIFMTTGGNKGQLLVELLGDDIKKFENIIFIDDGKANIDKMSEEFKKLKDAPNLHTFHYNYVADTWKARLNNKVYGKYKKPESTILNDDWKIFIDMYGSNEQKKMCN